MDLCSCSSPHAMISLVRGGKEPGRDRDSSSGSFEDSWREARYKVIQSQIVK